jgi:hypothetical protein
MIPWSFAAGGRSLHGLAEYRPEHQPLPVAAAGAGVGVDYGIYHFSRMIDTYDEIGDIDAAVDYATATTGKAIIFTATTMIAGTIFWWFSELKFQAEMGFLLALLMLFNTFGGLVWSRVHQGSAQVPARRRPRNLKPYLVEKFKREKVSAYNVELID